MLAIVLASAYREKFGGDHVDDVRAALAAYEERIGWKRRRPETTGALVFIGFMGAGKSLAARAAAAALGVEPVDSDAVLERRLGESIEDYFAAHGERAFREREEEAVAELLDHAGARRCLARRRRRHLERVREALARHTVVLLDVDADPPGGAAASAGGPLARDRERFDGCTPSAAALRGGSPTRSCQPAERERAARRRAVGLRVRAEAHAGTKPCGPRPAPDRACARASPTLLAAVRCRRSPPGHRPRRRPRRPRAWSWPDRDRARASSQDAGERRDVLRALARAG